MKLFFPHLQDREGIALCVILISLEDLEAHSLIKLASFWVLLVYIH